MKIAVVLFIKDEVEEIYSWISWYKLIGVDTIIVADDNSNDGTFEALSDISNSFDVRVTKLPPSETPHSWRQKEVYISAINNFKDEFEWIGFLDCDEYLRLEKHQNLKDFLGEFRPTVGQICFNWCNYGSSDNITKPAWPSTFSYRNHLSKKESINKHTKSFIRPKYWSGEWQTVHSFKMENDIETVNSSGKNFTWSDTVGIMENEPDWTNGKVMHFQCRSMEHFVERFKKRTDINPSTHLWLEYNKGHEYDDRGSENVLKLRETMGDFFENTIERVANEIGIFGKQYKHISIEKFESDIFQSINILPQVNLFKLKTFHGKYCSTDAHGLTVAHDGDLQKIYGIKFLDKNKIFIFSENLNRFSIMHDRRLCRFFSYDIFPTGKENQFFLRHPITKRFLTSEPVHIGGTIISDRKQTGDWEKFQIEKINVTDEILKERLQNISMFVCNFPNRLITTSNAKITKKDLSCATEIIFNLLDENGKDLVRTKLKDSSSYII